MRTKMHVDIHVYSHMVHKHIEEEQTHAHKADLPHNLLVTLISLSMPEACTAATVVMPARPSAVLYLCDCALLNRMRLRVLPDKMERGRCFTCICVIFL